MKNGKHPDRSIPLASVAIGALLLAACSPAGGVGDGTGGAASGTGGTTASGGISGGSGGATPGTGGANPGTGGVTIGSGGTSASGGMTAGRGGAPGGRVGTGSGGAAGGNGGRTATGGVSGTGGAGAATGGRGGAAGTMGAAGTTGAGGATPSSGCGKAPPASNRYTIDVGGTAREYILAVPTNYDMNQPYRVIFAWHPLGGTAQQTAGSGNSGYLGLKGASNGMAILVSPEGLPYSGTSLGWANTGGRDIAFLRAMIDRFKAEMCIDESRMFSTGFSFGGMMSYAVSCAGLARAIAPMSGNGISGCVSGTQPVAMMGFHGDDDTVVAISGGRSSRDVLVTRNKCTQTTMPTQPNWCDGVPAANMPCTCVTYQGCTAGYPVTWCEWNGPHNFAPNSAATVWSFFSQF